MEQFEQPTRPMQPNALPPGIDDSPSRSIEINNPSQFYCSNQVKSTSTNVLTFVPVNLWHQLHNLANVYFILIMILQTIPKVSVTNGKPTVLLPLGFVMLTVLIKDAYEEYYRYLKDCGENEQEVQVLGSSGTFQKRTWQSLRVGQIFIVRENQELPCDGLVLRTSHPDQKCYIQTKSLDGETNLKVRKIPKFDFNIEQISIASLQKKRWTIQCQAPNQYLHKFRGKLFLENGPTFSSNQPVDLRIDNLLLRGCHLTNVSQAICVCIYSGAETKVKMNSVKFSLKTSKLVEEINKMVFEIFIWQVVIALVASLLNTLLESTYPFVMDYLPRSDFWLVASSWWLLMTYFVPISLIVTMEMVKLFQGRLIEHDRKGFQHYQSTVSVNSTSVNENLGQIRYVFTDKTGTLTKNNMTFKKIVIDGNVYEGEDHQKVEMYGLNNITRAIFKISDPHVKFRDYSFYRKVRDQNIVNAMKVITLCNDVTVQKNSDGGFKYNSSSPDEIALLNFARIYGHELQGEEKGLTMVKVMQGPDKSRMKYYEKLTVLEFDSVRKCMSVIVRDEEGNLEVLTKGADSSVVKLLRGEQQALADTQQHIDAFSRQGLRTLMLARKQISKNIYSSWLKAYSKVMDEPIRNEENIRAVYKNIESQLNLIGATAVEDQLQDNCANTIRSMRAAGINFYILTGDKMETAISIGRSCGLVDEDAKIVMVPDPHTPFDIVTFRVKMNEQNVYLINASEPISPDLPLHLMKNSICFRCTPSQKEFIVRNVKERGVGLTLAIGDGSNDVNMITAADVGVGVRGKEGTQATRVSDYVVGGFEFLSFLTLYYGREWYRKNCRLVLYNFYKNWFHVTCVFVYGAYSYYSAVVIFDIFLYEMFNMFFTASPIILYALFDKNITYQEALRCPEKYAPGLKNQQFNQSAYMWTIGQGILSGMFSLVVTLLLLEDGLLGADGRVSTLKESGSVLFFTIILVVNIKILIMSTGCSMGLLVAMSISLALYWMLFFIQIMFLDPTLSFLFGRQWHTWNIFIVQFTIVFFLNFTELAYKIFKDKLLKINNRSI